jgi:hypothetical protein
MFKHPWKTQNIILVEIDDARAHAMKVPMFKTLSSQTSGSRRNLIVENIAL